MKPTRFEFIHRLFQRVDGAAGYAGLDPRAGGNGVPARASIRRTQE